MSTYLLVHGAWHGGWCWKRVAPILRRAGHDAIAVTLTGLGDRAHLLGRSVDLRMHAIDVAATLEYENLRDVVLVGHSYGGMVITEALERIPSERVASAVFLDAFVPENGLSLMDLLRPKSRRAFYAAAEAEGDGWKIPAGSRTFDITNEGDLAWVSSRLTPQPLATFEQAVESTSALRATKRTYIHCTQNSRGTFDDLAKQLAREAVWDFKTLQSGHDAMLIAPAELAALLLDCGDLK